VSEETTIDTYSGLRLDFTAPTPESICIEDIAAGLSKVCRFGGQALAFYSVAQHALLVRELMIGAGRTDLALAALHHDSHEAYACDIPKPLKRVLDNTYERICEGLDNAISARLGIPRFARGSEERTLIKEMDDLALDIESNRLLNCAGRATTESAPPTTIEVIGAVHEIMGCAEAERAFLDAHGASAPAVV